MVENPSLPHIRTGSSMRQVTPLPSPSLFANSSQYAEHEAFRPCCQCCSGLEESKPRKVLLTRCVLLFRQIGTHAIKYAAALKKKL